MSFKIGARAIEEGEILILSQEPSWCGEYETIERKGLGHPDSIADYLASKISQAYSRYTHKNCEGLVLHHQIDKLMIIGGKTEVTFGGGRFIEPIKVVVAGRASYSYKNRKIPVEQILEKTIRQYFKEHFPLVKKKDLVIENYLTSHAGPGTIKQSKGAIAYMFNPQSRSFVRGYDKLVANDTSYCVSYFPLSELEQSVLSVESFLNSKEMKKIYPWLGSDIKIMAVRNGDFVSVTMCIPQIAKFVKSLDEYKRNLNTIGKIIDKKLIMKLKKRKVKIAINTKDNYEKMNVYLTVSGASLSGDIGVVGRGNRTNGLITSNRPMSMEGTNGKNPRYYSGFIYALMTKKIAKKIYAQTRKACVVEIVSQNGGLLKKPWRTRIVTTADNKIVKNIILRELNSVENITRDFLDKKLEKNF